MIMIDQFINFVIRPPRADYNPDQYLWDRDFTLAGRKYKRKDLELKNSRSHTLKCSHYMPSPHPEDTPLPCVVYCHGNSGCRADANEAAVVLLPLNITVFTLDFSGSGLSDGDYVSLGWHEKDDLRAVVSYLRSNKEVSRIGLWGRSMGAVTSILYGSEDPSISGMVLDSAFSNLFDLMMEFVDVYKIRLPKFTVKMALQYMRRVVQKKAKFDIMDLNCTQVASKTCIPALFGHADEDKFIQPHHSDLIYKLYSGGKNMIKFSGDHNSSRPQLFYDSVSIFFYNTLYHPQRASSNCSNKLQMNCKLKDLKADTAMDESMLYEIITNLRIASTEAASSSSTSASFSTAKHADDALPEIESVLGTSETILGEDPASPSDAHFQDANAGEGCCSYSSSARESWDQCSSLGGSDSADCIVANNKEQIFPYKCYIIPIYHVYGLFFLLVFLTYVLIKKAYGFIRSFNRKTVFIKLALIIISSDQESVNVSEASKQTHPTDSTKKGKKKKRKKKPATLKKPSTGLEKLEALGQRIRLHMQKKANLIKRHS